VGVPVQEKRWRLRHGPGRAEAREVRSFRDGGNFTWADLLRPELAEGPVHAFYFPVTLRSPRRRGGHRVAASLFGQQSSAKTSVNFWDPKYGWRNFQRGRSGCSACVIPPALVLVTGLHGEEDGEGGEGKAPTSGRCHTRLDCHKLSLTRMFSADRQRLAAGRHRSRIRQ